MTSLYCIDKKGKIRVFKGEVELTGPTSPNTAYIHTYTGLLDGELIHKKETITKGKQKRSINEQAQFQLESKLNEKLDEGYKNKEQLEIHAESLGIREIFSGSYLTDGEQNNIEVLFKKLNIKFNTNRYWLPLPMLAEKWKDKKDKVKYPRIIQPKLNGVRCITLWSKEFNQVLMCSRGGQLYTMPHLTNVASSLHKFLQVNQEVQFDGELYRHGMPLQKINGIVQLEDKAQWDRKESIEYHIYDLAMEKATQAGRTLVLSGYDVFDFRIVRVPTFTVTDAVEVKKYHDEFVSQGYEGAIVRDPNAEYQFGFRDECLLKVKEFLDEEFEIIGIDIDPNKGTESFVFVLQNNTNDLTFKARPTGSLEDKEIWRQNAHNYIHKKATVRFQERTQDGLPHQGHVRHKDTEVLVEAIRDYE